LRKKPLIQHKILFDAKFHLDRFRNNVNSLHKFYGRSVNTDRATLKALIFFAQQNGAYTVSPGLRKISEFTGHDPRTTSNSLWRLHHKGWITNKFRPSHFDGRAARWRINWDAPFLVDAEDTDSAILREHMLWSGYCLGAKTELVYRAIEQNQNIKKMQICKLTNLGEKAVSTAIDKLTDENLISCQLRRYEPVIFESVEERQALIRKIKEKYNIAWKQQDKIHKYETDRLLRNRLMQTSKSFTEARDISLRFEQIRRSKTNPNATPKY
jgi:hypothetical protein